MILKRLLYILVCVFSVLACSQALSFPDRYDRHINSAAKQYLPGVDWRLLKAQFYQESRLDPSAVSPVGAAGVAQFMPATWLDASRSLGYVGISPHDAKYAIEAGAWYMGKMRSIWTSPRPPADRHSLAMASYNAGAGNILKSQKRSGGANDYKTIIRHLLGVTGEYSRETIIYVKRIWKYWTLMITGG